MFHGWNHEGLDLFEFALGFAECAELREQKTREKTEVIKHTWGLTAGTSDLNYIHVEHFGGNVLKKSLHIGTPG